MSMVDYPDWCRNIWTYIHIREGNPFALSLEVYKKEGPRDSVLPTVCNAPLGDNGMCSAHSEFGPCHTFWHSKTRTLATWDSLERVRDGVIPLDEGSELFPSEDVYLDNTRNLIVRNLRKRHTSILISEQYDKKIVKRVRAVIKTVVVPRPHIARAKKLHTKGCEEVSLHLGRDTCECPYDPDSDVDLNNHYIKNHIFNERDNGLELYIFRETDANWTRYNTWMRQQSHTGKQVWGETIVEPDEKRWFPVPLSVGFRYYDTDQEVSMSYSAEIDDAKATTEADSLAELIFKGDEKYSHIRRRYVNGLTVPTADLNRIVRDWNVGPPPRGWSQPSLDKITIAFLDHLPDYIAVARPEAAQTGDILACGTCGITFEGQPRINYERHIKKCGSKVTREVCQCGLSDYPSNMKRHLAKTAHFLQSHD